MKILSTFVIVAACIQNILSEGIVKRDTHIEECKFINVLLGKDEKFDCCTVDGMGCSDDGHIISITNPGIAVYDMPESVGDMPYLEDLSLVGLDLKGHIPQDIGNLYRLQFLRLGSNKLEGTIPESIGSLAKLEHLVLDTNDLVGTIPTSIEKCTKLTEIHVQTNRLSGELPTTQLEKLPLLNTIDVSDNENLYGKAPNTKVLFGCYYKTTKLCYAENEKNENCEYPDTHYDCAVCKDDKISTLTNGYCSCNEGYSGPAYIECTKATADNNNNNNNSNNNNNNSNNNNNNSNNNSDNNSGASSNLPSMKHLALAVFTIGILFI